MPPKDVDSIAYREDLEKTAHLMIAKSYLLEIFVSLQCFKRHYSSHECFLYTNMNDISAPPSHC